MNSIKITFEDSAVSSFFILELDEEKNEGRNIFPPGGEAYIRLYPSGVNPELITNLGSVSYDARGISLDVQEDITLINSDSATTKYPIVRLVSYEWIGRHTGNPKVRVCNGKILLSEKTTGVLRVKYTASYDRLKATCEKECTQLVIAKKENHFAYVSIKWGASFKEVVITVRDACTRTVIEGAKVYIDGKFVGLTDKKGQINLDKISTGKHTIRVTKEGYQPTDKDNIKNDYFVITDG